MNPEQDPCFLLLQLPKNNLVAQRARRYQIKEGVGWRSRCAAAVRGRGGGQREVEARNGGGHRPVSQSEDIASS